MVAPLDFLLCDYLKRRVFYTQLHDLEDLKERIKTQMRNISSEVFDNVRRKFYHRLYCCQNITNLIYEVLFSKISFSLVLEYMGFPLKIICDVIYCSRVEEGEIIRVWKTLNRTLQELLSRF